MKQKCPADCELKDGYGMTEVPLITRTKQEGSKPGSAGKLVSNVMAKVVDLDTNKSVGPNESGELLVKGTAKRKLERLQFSTSSSFVKIWSACSCEFKAYFWTFWALYQLLFDLETIGVN